jgi:hypothetical protein
VQSAAFFRNLQKKLGSEKGSRSAYISMESKGAADFLIFADLFVVKMYHAHNLKITARFILFFRVDLKS